MPTCTLKKTHEWCQLTTSLATSRICWGPFRIYVHGCSKLVLTADSTHIMCMFLCIFSRILMISIDFWCIFLGWIDYCRELTLVYPGATLTPTDLDGEAAPSPSRAKPTLCRSSDPISVRCQLQVGDNRKWHHCHLGVVKLPPVIHRAIPHIYGAILPGSTSQRIQPKTSVKVRGVTCKCHLGIQLCLKGHLCCSGHDLA